MQKIKAAVNKLSTILTRYSSERFTGQVTVTFNFSQGALGDVLFGVKHKFKP
jgi:hypothetical protein